MNDAEMGELIRTAQRGDIGPLVAALKGKSMSPTGFEKDEYGLSFGDGYMEDNSWLAVENAVMDGELSEDRYNEVLGAIRRRV